MKRIFLILAILPCLFLTGCPDIKPFSPENQQEIKDNKGRIEELKSNQNGLMLELGKLRNENTIMAEQLKSFQQQQGIANKQNSGIQILQGDGVIMGIVVLLGLGMVLVYHYRSNALKHQKTSEILAQQVAAYNDRQLDDHIFLAAMNTDVESDMYHLMVKSQALAGKPKT